jgi:hypothetical protein
MHVVSALLHRHDNNKALSHLQSPPSSRGREKKAEKAENQEAFSAYPATWVSSPPPISIHRISIISWLYRSFGLAIFTIIIFFLQYLSSSVGLRPDATASPQPWRSRSCHGGGGFGDLWSDSCGGGGGGHLRSDSCGGLWSRSCSRRCSRGGSRFRFWCPRQPQSLSYVLQSTLRLAISHQLQRNPSSFCIHATVVTEKRFDDVCWVVKSDIVAPQTLSLACSRIDHLDLHETSSHNSCDKCLDCGGAVIEGKHISWKDCSVSDGLIQFHVVRGDILEAI